MALVKDTSKLLCSFRLRPTSFTMAGRRIVYCPLPRHALHYSWQTTRKFSSRPPMLRPPRDSSTTPSRHQRGTYRPSLSTTSRPRSRALEKQLAGFVKRQLDGFKAATDSSSTTQEELRSHLKALLPWMASLPAECRADTIKEHKIGSRALLWIW